VYRELVEKGQSPEAIMIACCDSRVDPALITQSMPGEIFIARNIGNLIPPYEFANEKACATTAALEFAVRVLEVNHIIIKGHSQCGAINALMHPETTESLTHVTSWIDNAKNVREQVLTEHAAASEEERLTFAEKASLIQSLENLKTFPWIKDRMDEDKLMLHAWYFDLRSGRLLTYDEKGKAWVNA